MYIYYIRVFIFLKRTSEFLFYFLFFIFIFIFYFLFFIFLLKRTSEFLVSGREVLECQKTLHSVVRKHSQKSVS